MLADVVMVKTHSKSAHVNDLGFAWASPPPCCMDRLAPSLHGPALLLVPTGFPIDPPGGFAIPCRYTLYHPYICPCFWRKHFYTPLNTCDQSCTVIIIYGTTHPFKIDVQSYLNSPSIIMVIQSIACAYIAVSCHAMHLACLKPMATYWETLLMSVTAFESNSTKWVSKLDFCPEGAN